MNINIVGRCFYSLVQGQNNKHSVKTELSSNSFWDWPVNHCVMADSLHSSQFVNIEGKWLKNYDTVKGKKTGTILV